MCSNCNDSEDCDCTGGSAFVLCQCEKGVHCPVCGHHAARNLAPDPDLVMEIYCPGLLAEIQQTASVSRRT